MCRVWETTGTSRVKREQFVHMENDRIRVDILPYDGGRVVGLYDKKHGFAHIWTNKRTQHITRYYAANYDDVSGFGLEEAFPTVQPCMHNGVMLPFFGEVWPVPWEYELEKQEDAVAVRLWCMTSVFPAKLTKTFRLQADSLTFETEYTIENIGAGAFPYIFGVHPSVCITEDTVITVPQDRYKTGCLYPTSLAKETEFCWPMLGKTDLSHSCPFSDNLCVQFYTDTLRQGRYGFYHKKEQCGLEVCFSAEDFKSLSLWLIYGGWRGHYCVMSEIFSCWPAALDEAIKLGICETLQAAEKRTYRVCYVLSG